MTTQFQKGSASSMTEADANGKAWKITTCKNSRGEVQCSAVQGTLSEGIFSYEMFGGKRLCLATEAGIATESRIRSVHEKGLAELEKHMQNEPPVYVIEVGQVLKRPSRVIYEIPKAGTYKTVTLDGKTLNNYEQYLKESDICVNEKLPQEQIDALVKEATEIKERERIEREEQEAKQLARSEEAKKWFQENKPNWAKAIIIAELEEDTIDPMSDYFGSRTVKRLLLAFSATDRNDFSEMRKAAENAEETKHLAEYDQKLEHRDNYTGGNGYWLGEHRYSGWQINKQPIGQYTPTIYVEDVRVKPQEAPVSVASSTGDKLAISKINTEKKGIEIYFQAKPETTVLDDLKANGFRWSRFNKCWYKSDNSLARQVAAKYAELVV